MGSRSPAPSMAWLNGAFVPWSDAVLPVEDRGLLFAESIYEVVALAGGRAHDLEEHLARMRRGLAALGISEGFLEDAQWREVVAGLLEADPLPEGLLYIQVTGGAAPRNHVRPSQLRPNCFAYLRRFRFPRAPEVQRGISTITHPDFRWGRCDLKTTMLLSSVMGKHVAKERGAGEVLWLSPKGTIHEGGASNLFVVERGRVISPPFSKANLPGITKGRIMRAAHDAGIEFASETIDKERLLAADEAFVSSTTFLVMPVTAVDGQTIGTREGGPISLQLAQALREEMGLGV